MMYSLEELLSKPDMSQYILAEWYKRCTEQNPRLIRIVSAKAGAGKTLGLTKDISENPQKSMIVCQIISLLDQTKETLTDTLASTQHTSTLRTQLSVVFKLK
jgi:superfamily II DNA or RNA helicase